MKKIVLIIGLIFIFNVLVAQNKNLSNSDSKQNPDKKVELVFQDPQLTSPDKYIKSQNHRYFVLTDDLSAGHLAYGVFQVKPPMLKASGVLQVDDEKCFGLEVKGLSDDGKYLFLQYNCKVFGSDYPSIIYDIDNDTLIRNVEPSSYLSEIDQTYYYFDGKYGFKEYSGPDNLVGYSEDASYTAEYDKRVIIRDNGANPQENDLRNKKVLWESEKQKTHFYEEGSLINLKGSIVLVSDKSKKDKNEQFNWYDFINQRTIYTTKNPFAVFSFYSYMEENKLVLPLSGYPYSSIDSEAIIDLTTGKYSFRKIAKGKVREYLRETHDQIKNKTSLNDFYYRDAHSNLWSIFRNYYNRNGRLKDSLNTGQLNAEFYPTYYWNPKNYSISLTYDWYIFSSYDNKIICRNLIPNNSTLRLDDYRQEIKLIFWNGSKNDSSKRIVNMMYLMDGGPFFYTDDRYYMSSSNLSGIISFKSDGKLYPFEQFDLKFNRPDIILNRLGYTNKSLIKAYHKAYLKRLKRMDFTEDMLKDDFHIPEVEIANLKEIPTTTDKDSVILNLNIIDSKYKLDRINVWVNNVPIYGTPGIDLRNKNTQEYKTDLKIPLGNGNNKIQVSVLNQAGAESYKETKNIRLTKSKNKPNLFFIALSVSSYKDKRMNLQYAAKDGRDMINLFLNNKNQWSNVYVDTLFDQRAIKENVLKLKQKLLKTDVNDQVILYVSGHGLLDKNYDFYFATHDINFDEPSKRGVSYSELEWLLDSIPARKKLFMMDACHSGEVDKEAMRESKGEFQLVTAGDIDGKVSGQQFKGATVVNQPKLGLQNSFELMQELFTDLNRGSGAQVISAAAGNSYALESPEWNNGVFTYAVLNGLKDYKADANGDKEITISELKKYVSKRVVELTNGAQKPTTRQENVEFDFRVW